MTNKHSRKTNNAFTSLVPHALRYEAGKKLREDCPRESHAVWKAAPDRPDTLHLLKESNKERIPELIPIRYGRMMKSPFTFFRGAALNMAADLSTTPSSGLHVQACGDCHLSNFGAFATPERRVIADINDFDETLPAPWEWDVKRLTTSFVLASRNNDHKENDARDAALACVRSYRESMAEFSQMQVLDIWYASVELEELLEKVKDKEARKRAEERIKKARSRNVMEDDFPELVTKDDTGPAIKDNKPLIFHPLKEGRYNNVRKAFAHYRKTLPDSRRVLLDRYKLIDIAVKVVGVGSVGTACLVALMMASENDPLFLQVKQARHSVLEAYAGKSRYANHGQRVVNGQQIMQSASDLFLGWTKGLHERHYYIRQLRDMKIKPLVELYSPEFMLEYAQLCGSILARSHARSGDPSQISGYLGKSDKFDEAIADFSFAYADQSERDHEILVKEIRKGKLEVVIEE